MLNNKPSILYRGVSLDYDMLQQFHFLGVDLVPPNAPFFNERGQKVVMDGNEYGVYMTDNYIVAVKAYAESNRGLEINNKISYDNNSIKVPSVGVVYQINTNGIEIRRPYIKPSMRGHYNNGYEGNEYIADNIPAGNYKIIKIIIGADLLHDSENIEVSDIERAELFVRQRIEERKKHLEEFVKELEKMDARKRRCLRVGRELEVFKRLFGDEQIVNNKLHDIKLNDANDCIKYLLLYYYISSINDLDIRTLIEINSIINGKLSENSSLEDFVTVMNHEIDNKSSGKIKLKYMHMLDIIKNKLNNSIHQENEIENSFNLKYGNQTNNSKYFDDAILNYTKKVSSFEKEFVEKYSSTEKKDNTVNEGVESIEEKKQKKSKLNELKEELIAQIMHNKYLEQEEILRRQLEEQQIIEQNTECIEKKGRRIV